MDTKSARKSKTKKTAVVIPRKPVTTVKTYTPSSNGSTPFLRRKVNEASPEYRKRVEQAKFEDQEARAAFIKDYAKSFAIVPASIHLPSLIPNLKSMKSYLAVVETHALQQKKIRQKTLEEHRRQFANTYRLKHGWAMESLFWDKKYIGVDDPKPIKTNKVVSIFTTIFSLRK